MPELSPSLLYILFLTFYINLTVLAQNTDIIYDDDEPILRCIPRCKMGYLCERRNDKAVCIFVKSLIAIIVILSLLGIIALVAGITVLSLCFSFAFHQKGLNWILRKKQAQIERERKRNKQKKTPTSATYFDDELQKRRAAVDVPSLEVSGTTIRSAYVTGPLATTLPLTAQGGGEVDVHGHISFSPTPTISPSHSIFVGLEMEKPLASVKTTGKTPSNKSPKSEDTA